MKTTHRQSGFTLIELMVAMGLGLTLVAGTIVIFVQNNRSAVQDEEISRILENGRFVVRQIGRELAMSGFWGKFLDVDTTAVHASVVVGQDCGDGVNDWATDLTALGFVNNATTAAVAAAHECLPSGDIVAGSDVIAVQRVSDSTTTDGAISAGQLYLRTNGVAAQLFQGGGVDTPPAMTGTVSNWAYLPQVYYIRDFSVAADDGIPTLCRAYMDSGANPDMTNECLVDGVENLQFEFGVDEDGDFIANYYTASPTAAEISDSVSLRLYVLVRSINTVAGYVNDKSYELGSTIVPAPNDGFFRRVFTSTILLRNPSNLTGLNS
ncbi:MAG: PilW family protein [Pseudohongiellaceae bacterium]